MLFRSFQDAAGNTGSINANVDWIDNVVPTAELKYEKQEDKVIVTVVNPSKEITFKEGNGIYEYTKNGNYEIIFYDSLGNVGKLIAKIDSFKEEIKDDENNSENSNKPNNPDANKPENSDKPNNSDDNKPENLDKPNDNTNNTNSSNTNNNNKDDNITIEKPDNNRTDNEEQKPDTTNTGKEDNKNNNSTIKVESDAKRSKVILVVITTTLSLLALCAYVIKKSK